jgi:hypothetical protein
VTRRLLIAALAAGIAVALAGCGGGGGKSSRTDYVQANQALFKTLPAYPHATAASGGTTSYAGKNNSVGYQTRYTETVPPTATATKLQTFFAGRLQPDWKLVAQLDGPVLNFRKGNAFVSINMTSSAKHKVEVTVDQAFYKHVG